MPLDHYVSQVHLKQFYSPVLGERMFAVRKSDLKEFTSDSRSVCRIQNGSSNSYLNRDRAIEEFLKLIEPNYNVALNKISLKQVDSECIYTIAGFVAYISTCSPGAMRVHSKPLESIVKTTATILDKKGIIPPAPSSLGSTNISDLLDEEIIKINVDPKYPQAIGITSILNLTSSLGNSIWEFLHNPYSDSPYFTSDYPIAIESTADPRIINKIVPLSPNIAIRIIPDINQNRDEVDLSFRNCRFRFPTISRKEVGKLNQLIVRCAEDAVFYKDDLPWVKPFVIKNRNFRIETQVSELVTSTGMYLIYRQKISPYNQACISR